jgi:hypothetical protein
MMNRINSPRGRYLFNLNLVLGLSKYKRRGALLSRVSLKIAPTPPPTLGC